MLNKYAAIVRRSEEVLASLVLHIRADLMQNGDVPLADAGWAKFVAEGTWVNLRNLCKELELDSVSEQLNRIQLLSSNGSHATLSELDRQISELKNRFADQLMSRWFLHVPTAKVPCWENELYFGEDVAEKIPDAKEDIYEACSCFAVGRYSAAVYHCIGIMQAAFFQVGKANLSCTIDLDVDDWGSASKKIEEAVESLRKQAQARSKDASDWSMWKQVEPLYAELISDVNAVKKAWRHTSAHFRQKFNEEQAEKVLDKVGDFMKTVAKLLSA
jgi:hypothetical protein